ncbi:MAG: hypothetical protein LBK06_05800 [Planctomycetaceae bacterium]|nr:hypothetical protein [Planctomycetaceae bacterium]
MKVLCIPEPVWAVGFALEQSLHVVALACSAFRILKRLQHNFNCSKNSKNLLSVLSVVNIIRS